MSRDILFKTVAFGGFKKDEVMDFIEKILSEKSELEKHFSSLTATINGLEAKISELESDLSDKKAIQGDLLEKCERIAELEAFIEEKDELITELTRRASNSEETEALESEIQLLRAENARLKAEIEKKRDIERQVGAAMLDARAHSEELVEAAKERAGIVTREAYASIGDAALQIDSLSLAVGEIARSFVKSVEDVELRIKVLTGDMSKVAQTLISDGSSASDTTIPEYDFSVPATDEGIVIEEDDKAEE